jgi:hypothetical protein
MEEICNEIKEDLEKIEADTKKNKLWGYLRFN